MKIPEIEIYYEDEIEYIDLEEETMPTRIGYSPKTKKYYSVRDADPLFCFEGDSRDEVIEETRRALEFYIEHGLNTSNISAGSPDPNPA